MGPRAERFATKLRSIPEHNFDDDLNCLPVAATETAFRSAIAEIEHRAAPDVQLTIEAGDWLNAHGLGGETLRWFGQLPETVRMNVRVQITMAESYLNRRDWKGLQAFLSKSRWDDSEYLRRAMLIRAQRELCQPWEQDWKKLVTEAGTDPQDPLLLAQLVVGWNWRAEALELLWGAAARPVTASGALELLWQLYCGTNETRELLRVAKAQLDAEPASPAKKNNYAFLSLLLDGGSQLSERLAREACTLDPSVPEWAATYSYALHLAGKDVEARDVVGKLASEALARPGIALYYAIILAANGDQALAREALAKLNTTGMLPEERRLAADLAQQLGVSNR